MTTFQEGDRVRFNVPGGHIDATVTDGFLYLHGVEDLNPHTHQSRLLLSPESANDLAVGLTPLKKRATFRNGPRDTVPGSEEDLIWREQAER